MVKLTIRERIERVFLRCVDLVQTRCVYCERVFRRGHPTEVKWDNGRISTINLCRDCRKVHPAVLRLVK
jgi:hypothetical protein